MSWYHQEPVSQLSSTVDVGAVLSFLDTTESLRYHMHSISLNKYSACILPSSVRRAITKGHHDMELWVYVNPLIKMCRPDSNGNMRDRWEHNGKTQSFVIDYDNLRGINNIEDFITVQVARNMPLPYYISQTGPSNFHAFYLGKFNEWTQDKVIWLLKKWACITEDLDHMEFLNQLHDSGIDTNYYSQHYGMHKLRVPGSLNPNHINEDGTFWKILGWANPKYNNADDQYYNEISAPRPNFIPQENVVSIAAIQPVASNFRNDLFVEPILLALNDLFPNGMSTKLENVAKMLSANIGWLLSNDCRIRQVKWAQEWGCQQFDVSRILRHLISKEVLVKVDDYFCPNRISKMYGAGKRLKEVVNWSGGALPQPQWVKWDDGTSNERMLYDVRYFISMGMKDEEILHRLQERQAHRPRNKIRPTSDFLFCIKSAREWNKAHFGYYKPNVAQQDAFL